MSDKLSRDRIVVTFTKKRAKRSQCKKIKGDFYLVGDINIKDSGECYLVEGTYHRFNNERIEYDYEQMKYVLIHKTHLKHGIVDINENGEKIEGYFSPNLTKNITLSDIENTSERISCISEELAKKLNYREHYSSGIFYDRSSKNTNFFKKIGKSPVNKRDLPYDSRFANNITSEQYDKFYKPKYDNKYLNILGDFLESSGITFGLEFETSTGYIPDRLCYKYGLIPLRDGSIKGLEYVTIPYAGRKGLYALRSVCDELNKRTKYDMSCALHLHLAGVNRNMTNILSSFILSYLVQDEMFNMQPAYKRGGLGVKDKDYCKPLDDKLFNKINKNVTNSNITEEFAKLFYFVSDGRDFENYDNSLTNVDNHPSDPSGTAKWHIRSRYKWVNFVPIVFGNKKTIEFRHHSATFSFEKIINFLFTCSTIIKVSNDFKKEVLNSDKSLRKKLDSSKSDKLNIISNYLLKNGFDQLKPLVDRNNVYNKLRKEMIKDMTKKGDIVGETEDKYNSKLHSKLDESFWK